jgi:hypothetical protein
MITWSEKFKWLRRHGYTILAAPDGAGWTATSEQGLKIDFNLTMMTVHNEPGNLVTGWLQMGTQSFKLLTVSLGIIYLTAEERDEMQSVINENYARQFLNQLS